ncbi:MAG TPA: PrsW family intramembrane metalloprotease [Candidatus Avipropionibacterium avicola]|uniref:PrsW family intramembrane metalloprotease n=1 Tax=Candidatus Avipropionibacterium avicola TaxID=2840701 RepID=A0A9D1KLX4_9ACTN|nr:PrsW family intramembrane metalloprotease [Candidatus Avipropionibacterium avicola]
MTCPRCRAGVPDVAHFCHRCGQDLRAGDDQTRRNRFAVKPDEPVASFAILSTIMPRGVNQRPSTYRLALVAGLTIALISVIFGNLPSAILVSVVTIPLVYIVYLYDVNLWDDQPVRVTALAFGVTFAAGLVFTIAWTRLSGANDPTGGFSFGGLLVFVLLVPIIGEVIRQVGPVLLASRPQFDDLLDGLTFGVVAGVAYSAAETLVMYWPSIVGGSSSSDGIGTWVSVIFLHGFIKPVILGTASGIAAAEFAGLGKGYDGFTARYLRGLGIAIGGVAAFYLGLYLLGLIPDGVVSVALSVFWGLAVAGALVILLRTALHTGLLEAALESAAREGGVGDGDNLEFCAACEMPLMEAAQFCNACGSSVRLQRGKPASRGSARSASSAPSAPGAPTGPSAPSAQGAPAAAAAGGVTVAERLEHQPPPDEPPVDDEPTIAIVQEQPAPEAPTDPVAHPLDQGDWADGDGDDSDGAWEVGPQTDPAGEDPEEDQR